MLSLLEHAVETTRRTARGEQGRICVGVTPTAPFHPFVQQALRSFQDAYPMVALTLEENLTHDILRFQYDQIDVAFIRNRVANAEGLLIMPLLEEDMWVAFPSNHKLAGGYKDGQLCLEHLAQEPFILYGPPGSGIHDATIAACQAAGFSPRVSQRAPRITSTLGLVASGLGISLVPESMKCVLLPGVTYRQLNGPVQAKAALNLVARRGDASAVVRHFVGMVSAQIKNYVAP